MGYWTGGVRRGDSGAHVINLYYKVVNKTVFLGIEEGRFHFRLNERKLLAADVQAEKEEKTVGKMGRQPANALSGIGCQPQSWRSRASLLIVERPGQKTGQKSDRCRGGWNEGEALEVNGGV